jgi:hypothetical protein
MSECTSKDRAELDLYFRLTGEPSELRPGEAHEDRLRKQSVLLKRSPRAHQALVLARDTLRRFKPGDALVLLPKTSVACLALLEALDAPPELTLEIREFNPWGLFGPHCIVASGGGVGGSGAGDFGAGGGASCGGQGIFVSGGGVGGCGGGGGGPGFGHTPFSDRIREAALDAIASLQKNPQSDV